MYYSIYKHWKKQPNQVVAIEKPVEKAVEVVKSEPEEKAINEDTSPKGKREIIREAQSKVFTIFTDSSQGWDFYITPKAILLRMRM